MNLKTIFKNTLVIHTILLVIAILFGGSIIRLYGNTCGISIFEPYGWIKASVLIGSSWCKTLNWIGYVTTNIVENMWFHIFGIVFNLFLSFIPDKQNYNNRQTKQNL